MNVLSPNYLRWSYCQKDREGWVFSTDDHIQLIFLIPKSNVQGLVERIVKRKLNLTSMMLTPFSPTSQHSQSPWPISSFIFNDTCIRNHNMPNHALKLVVFATDSSSTTDKKSYTLKSRCLIDKCNGFSIKEGLDFKENPRRLQARKFMDAIKDKTDIFRSIKEDGRNWTISDFNDLLMALITANELEIALKLYSEISSYGLAPDSWTFSIMLRCHSKKNDLAEAGRILNYMVDNGFYPNVSTFTVFINSLCKSGRLQKSFEVVRIMGTIGCKPSIQTYNCLLKGLCYVGRVEEAYEMFMNIKKDSMKPDIYTYTIVMDGFCKVGRSDEAMELLNEAIERGLTPNVITFNTLFHGYCKEGRPTKGIAVLKLMKQRNCMPDNISYSTLLNALLKWGKAREALKIFKEMMDFGFEMDERMVNTLLRGLCMKAWEEKDLLEDAYQVFEKMKNEISIMDPGTYGMVIRALGVGNKTDEAWAHLRHMVRIGHVPRTITFNNVIQAFCHERKVDEAFLVVFLMYEHGKIPSKTSYDMLIKKLNQLGRPSDACTVYGAALKLGVLPQNGAPSIGSKLLSSTTMFI